MTPLRQRMLEDMQVRNLPLCTQRSYVEQVSRFARHFTRWIACRPGFCLPVRVLSRLFRRLFLASLQDGFKAGRLHFAGALHALADRSNGRTSPRMSSPRGTPTGSSMPNGPSPLLHRSWSTSAATRIASPSPTSACSTWRTVTSGSATRTTVPIPRRRRRR